MSRSLMLIILGAIIVLSPFSRLPLSILTWILPVLGLVAVAIGVSYRTKRPAVSESVHEASLSTSS